MLSRIDEIIYPNRCEVIEFQDPQRFVYPIFKNGSSSLISYAKEKQFKFILNNQINQLQSIDVFVRPQSDRFISGINSFVFDLIENNPKLDYDTIIYFVENYLFLNRHYSPQIGWLLHLSQFLNKNATIKLCSMAEISNYTPLHIKSYKHYENSILAPTDIERLINNIHNKVYLQLDDLLLELIGQTLTFTEILEKIKINDPVAYKKICTALG